MKKIIKNLKKWTLDHSIQIVLLLAVIVAIVFKYYSSIRSEIDNKDSYKRYYDYTSPNINEERQGKEYRTIQYH